MTSTRQFSCRPESVTAARHFVRNVLCARERGAIEAAELMTSELATNAVRHARSAFELTVRTTSEEIRVEVRDMGEGQPTPGSPSPGERSGRGLRIVQAMADSWGTASTSGGKLVWFTLTGERAQTQVAEPTASHELNLRSRDPTETANPRPDPETRSHRPASPTRTTRPSGNRKAQPPQRVPARGVR
jgi:anti-sigma regulatory factor (Ser/Thr protein kinase)